MFKDWIYNFIQQHTRHPEHTKINEVRNVIIACCPLPNHYDAHPSFAVNYESGAWICQPCGKAGRDIESLIAYVLQIPYHDACELVNQQIFTTPQTTLAFLESIGKEKSHAVTNTITQCILPPKTDDQQPMYKYFRFRKYSKSDTRRCVAQYSCYYCNWGRYRNRIICPIFDINGKSIYFTNRAVDNHPKKTLFPSKYEVDLDKHYLGEQFGITIPILVEGMFSAFRVFTYGYEPISCLSCEPTDIQIKNIVSRYKHLILCFDNDIDNPKNPGVRGMRRLYKKLYDVIPMEVMILPNNKDPDECTKEEFDLTFNERFSLEYDEIQRLR